MFLIRLWNRLWLERRNKLWVLPALNSAAAVLLALAAAWVPALLPQMQLPVIAPETLESLLTVIASSMLAVTTFSLSIMVSAFASASSGVTPRATELVMGDEGTRSAIANFLSAFIYALVAQIALGLKIYGDNGRFILFVGTLCVLAWLVLTLLRWVKTLSSLGRLSNTLRRIEDATLLCLRAYWSEPLMGAQAPEALGACQTVLRVTARDVLLVRRIELPTLQALAQEWECLIQIRIRPGQLCSLETVLADLCVDESARQAWADLDASTRQERSRRVAACFQLDAERTFDQDPRFGMLVLREAAQRALSAAINDPGTAIACLNIMTRSLLKSQIPSAEQAFTRCGDIRFDRLSVPALAPQEFLIDGFDPVARDGAASFEIAVKMQKLLGMLAQESPSRELALAAGRHAVFAYECAAQALVQANDVQELKRVHQAQGFEKSTV